MNNQARKNRATVLNQGLVKKNQIIDILGT